MRIFLLLTILFLFAFLFLCWIIVNPVFAQTKKVTIPVSKDRLYQDVSALTTIHPARNYKNLASLNKAADYIQGEFDKLENMRVERQSYQAEGNMYHNVIASYGNENAERLIVGAHYDVCGDQDGADDNASAVAGLLEMARILNELAPALDYRIDFVAYSLEEPPFFRTPFMGSAVHAQSLKDANVKVKGMVCLEMLGYFSEEPNSQAFPIGLMKLFYPTTGNFIAVIGKFGQGKMIKKVKKHMKEVANIDVRSITAPKALPGIDFSDHQNYWNHGYDAVMINNTAFYRNQNYHLKSDTIETLDFDKMTEVVRGAYWAVVSF